MGMEINNFSYKDKSSISFRGLTSVLSKRVYDKTETVALYKNYYKKSRGVVGRLPAEWIYTIPFEERTKTIKEVFAFLGRSFSNLRLKYEDFSVQKQVAKELTDFFKSKKIIGSKDKVGIEFAGSGAYGNVYKLNVQNKSYAVKVFSSPKNLKSFDNLSLDYCNGNFFEQNIAQFLTKKIPKRKKNLFHFYFGDMKNGIMVSKFEDGENPFLGRGFDYRKIGLLLADEEHFSQKNNIAGKIIDVGCIDIMEHAKNKTLAYVFSKSMASQNAPYEILEKTLNWKPSKIKNDRIKGVIYSFQNLSDENAKKCIDEIFKHLSFDDNKEVFQYLAGNIFKVPSQYRKLCFDKLIKCKDKEVNISLAQNIDCMRQDVFTIVDSFKKLKSINDEKVDFLLTSKLYNLTPKQLESIYPLFLKKSTPEVRKNLLSNVPYLPDSEQQKYLEKLADFGDKSFVDDFLKSIFFYNDKNIKSMGEYILKKGNIEQKRALSKNIKLFLIDDMSKIFENLYKLDDDVIKLNLSSNITLLPEDKQNYWSKLLVCY